MDSSSQIQPSAVQGAPLTPRSIEHPDDYFKQRGIEPSRVKFDAEYESPEELQSRLKREEAEQTARLEKEKADQMARLERERAESSHKRFKETSVYAVAILAIVALIAISLYTLSSDNQALKEDRAKAWATLTAVSTAIVGYLFGKNSSSTS